MRGREREKERGKREGGKGEGKRRGEKEREEDKIPEGHGRRCGIDKTMTRGLIQLIIFLSLGPVGILGNKHKLAIYRLDPLYFLCVYLLVVHLSEHT